MANHDLTVKFWGTRGSLPSSLLPHEWALHFEGLLRGYLAAGNRDISQIPKFFSELEVPTVGGYGTATTCVEVATSHGQVIIDGGSGIRTLSDKIMTGNYGGRTRGPFHIYLTHFHWDHLIGLPFFTPHFLPGVHIHYYSTEPQLESLIRGVFKRPYFPMEFERLSAKIHFHVLEPRKPKVIDDITITPYMLDHPDPCWGLKVQANGKTYAHCVDTEGTRVSREDLGPDLPLYEGVDLMYFDAQYTFPELAEKANWGHSAAQIGLDIALREGIKNVLFAHHDPGASVQMIQEIKRQTKEYYDWRMDLAKKNAEELKDCKWDFAYEGLEVRI